MIFIEPDEHIISKVRKHWIVLIRDVSFLATVLLFPLLLYIITWIVPLRPFIIVGGNHVFLASFLVTLWLLFCWTMLFVMWTDYYLDILVVTNKRVFDIEQKSIFRRDSSICRLDRIQDITIATEGMFATFLNFGNVIIQTAGEREVFVIRNLPNPFQIKKLISDEHDRALEKLYSQGPASEGSITEKTP